MVKLAPNDRAIPPHMIDPVNPQPPSQRTEADAKLLERIRRRMERCIQTESDNRKMAVEDLKFYAGEQWAADVAAQRNTDKRPCLTINRVKPLVHQVVNAARENRPGIIVDPVGDSDKDAAAMLQGVIRMIERQSKADIAYDTALESAVACGWGYMRLTTEYESEDSLDETVMIRRVRNRFSVYLDPDSLEPDGSDCRFGFQTEIVPLDEFKEEYPKAAQVPFDMGGQGEKYKNWVTKDGIRVAEYFEVTKEDAEVVKLSSGYEGYMDDLDDLTEARIARGEIKVLESRESYRRKVKYYKVTAVEVLEESEWPGLWVPIVPVLGDEIDLEGKVVKAGIIRDAKDPQRMLNYWETSKAELAALQPKAPYIMEEGQLEGHEQEWKTANTKPNPVLTYKASNVAGHPAPPPQRSAQPQIAEAMVQASQQAAQDIMATTGIRFDPTQEKVADQSGRAIRELAMKSDVGAFHYVDNLARSMKFLGDQLIDLIPKVYDRRKVMTILGEGDVKEQVTLDPMAGRAYAERKGQDGKTEKVFNPKLGRYQVSVDVGPSYATKRQEAAQSMMEFVRAMPNTAQLVMDLIATEMDWPGAEKIAARLARAIPPQLMAPDQKDISPQAQAVMQHQQAQLEQLSQQLQQALAALKDKDADRQVALEKISRDFEAKVLAIVEKSETAQAKAAAENARTTIQYLDKAVERMHAASQPQQQPEQQPNA